MTAFWRLHLPRAAAAGRPRHRRRRHRLRPHRPRPRRRGLRGVDRAQARAGRRRHPVRHPLHRRRRRPLHQGRAGVRGPRGDHRQGRQGQGQPGRDRRADRLRQPHRARAAEAPVPALLALQEAGDLPQHAAVVHRHGPGDPGDRARPRRRHPARARGDGDRPDALRAARRPQPSARDDRAPARLGRLAPARLGRAHHRFRPCPDGRDPARRCRRHRHRRRLRGGGRRRLVRGRRQGTLPRRPLQRGRMGDGDGHPRRVVRFRLHPRLLPRQAARPEVAGGRLSGRLRPAPRVVPLLAPGVLRHPRPRAVRDRHHPRLHHGRGRAQDVQVAGQHHRPAGHHQAVRGRHPAALGGLPGLRRRSAHRRGDHEGRRRLLPQAAQLHPLDAGNARLRGRRRGGPFRCAGAGAADAAPPRSARRRGEGRLPQLRLRPRRPHADDVRQRRAVGLLLRHPQGRALLRRALLRPPPRGAGGGAPSCSMRW